MPYIDESLFKKRYSTIVGCLLKGTFRRSYLYLNPYCLVIVVCCLIIPPCSLAGDKPFNNASNWGGTGLMETPTARILEDEEMRVEYAYCYPYRWYSVAMGVLPGLEFDGTLTAFINQQGFTNIGGDYGEGKDKAFHIKYQILAESKLLPAIAIGLQDFHGTQLFSSQYLALSRQVFPFDLTLGIGKGRLRGSTTFGFLDDVSFMNDLGLDFEDYGLFGGLEVAVTDRIHLMAEYNPIQYEKDKATAGRAISEAMKGPAKSKLNYGARVKLLSGTGLSVSYQRGDALGLMFSLQFELGRPMRPWKPDPPRLVPADQRPFRERKPKDIVEAVQNDVYKQGFSNVRAYTDGKDLVVEFENTRYLSEQKALGRVLRIALAHAPEDTRQLVAVPKRLNIPVSRFSVEPAVLANYLGGRIPEDIFRKLSKVELMKRAVSKEELPAYSRTENQPGKRVSHGIKPGLEMYLNDPSGFYKARLSVNPWAEMRLWGGADAYARFKIPLYTNVSTSNIIPENPVRSDIVDFKGTNATFDRIVVDQVVHLTDRTFGRLSLGYLELMYAGVGTELLTFLGDGRIAVGVEGNWVRKREPGDLVGLGELRAHTFLGNFYYTIPGLDLTLKAQYGEFLAGDKGWMFEASRAYPSGVTVGAWYSLTDTDGIPGSFNKDYHEKGVFLKVPTRMFEDRDSPRRYDYAISPWTRDVAQNVEKRRTLFDLTKGLTPAGLRAGIEKIKN